MLKKERETSEAKMASGTMDSVPHGNHFRVGDFWSGPEVVIPWPEVVIPKPGSSLPATGSDCSKPGSGCRKPGVYAEYVIKNWDGHCNT